MDRWVGKIAVVTGASSGIGEAVAVKLVENGLKVIGLARRLEKLKGISEQVKGAKGTFHPVHCDVSKEEDILKTFKFAKSLGGVDVLINNAGVAFPENIIDGSTENFKTILDVNLLAVAICTREATKSMRDRKVPGHIININSVLGHDASRVRSPFSLYQTSKYGITAMSEVVRNEIAAAKEPIKVTSLSPGLVKTEMPLLNLHGGEAVFKQLPHIQSRDIADAVVYVLSTPPNVQVSELTIMPLHEVPQEL